MAARGLLSSSDADEMAPGWMQAAARIGGCGTGVSAPMLDLETLATSVATMLDNVPVAEMTAAKLSRVRLYADALERPNPIEH